MKPVESNNKTNFITIGGLIGVTLLSGAILSSSLASADDAVDVVTITVPPSCSMSSTGNNSHVAEINNGQFNSAIGETTITTFCNDNNGFAIYAIGYTGDALGNNVLTDVALGSTYDIATGTATSGQTSNWAMKLSTIASPTPTYPIIIAGSSNDSLKVQGDSDFSSFQAIPDSYTKVAYRTAGTDTGTNGDGSTIKTTYQAYISPTQSAGTYQGKVKYVLVHPSTTVVGTYTVTFNANGGSGTMGSLTGLRNIEDQTVAANEFTAPSGYRFAGWCTVQDQTQSPQTACPGTTYAANAIIPANTVVAGDVLSLYAIWEEAQIVFYDVTVQIGSSTESVVFSNETYGSTSIVESIDGTEKVMSFAAGVVYDYTAKASQSDREDFIVDTSENIIDFGYISTCDDYSTQNGSIQINGPGTIYMRHHVGPC